MAKIIDGKAISAELRRELRVRTEAFAERTGVRPGLAVVLVGDDPASQVYVRNKQRACEQVGFHSEQILLPADTEMATLREVIARLNVAPEIHGILVQLPLPPQLDEHEIIMLIDPEKDVDAFHPINVGRIVGGRYRFAPCTPAGIMQLLRRSGVVIEGRECVVIGRSDIVGKPMALLLLEANGTVTVCHSRTVGLAEICRRADILVSAVGKPGFVTADMVKPGAVVIDVGINRLSDGRLVGDVDREGVEPVAGMLTPVPGGVGPMTITMLLDNTLRAAEAHYER